MAKDRSLIVWKVWKVSTKEDRGFLFSAWPEEDCSETREASRNVKLLSEPILYKNNYFISAQNSTLQKTQGVSAVNVVKWDVFAYRETTIKTSAAENVGQCRLLLRQWQEAACDNVAKLSRRHIGSLCVILWSFFSFSLKRKGMGWGKRVGECWLHERALLMFLSLLLVPQNEYGSNTVGEFQMGSLRV